MQAWAALKPELEWAVAEAEGKLIGGAQVILSETVALWGHARHIAAENGTAIGTQFDPRGPIAGLVPVRPWTPKGVTVVAVRSDIRLSEDRLLSPP